MDGLIGLQIAWSCGPAQIFGIGAIPYGLYQYYCVQTDEAKRAETWDGLKFNVIAAIPVVGTMFAIDATKPVKPE